MLDILGVLLNKLFSALTPEMVKDFIDGGLDKIEDKIASTSTQVDDKLVLPIIELIRKVFDIPDND